MKRLSTLMLVLVLNALATASAIAAEGHARKAIFSVEKMSCASCPITVRKAMQRVDGVRQVIVDFDSRTATVVFDPRLTDAIQIGAASASVGFPATLVEEGAE